MRKIILPLSYRTILLATLISVIGSMLAVDQFIIMTGGNPRGQTFTSVYWIYQNSFVFFKLGYGSALSVILMLIIFGFAAGANPPHTAQADMSSIPEQHGRRRTRTARCDSRRAAPLSGVGARTRAAALPHRRDLLRGDRDDARADRAVVLRLDQDSRGRRSQTPPTYLPQALSTQTT